MSSRIEGLKRMIETIGRNIKDTGPGSNGAIIGNWFVRIVALGCGVGIGYNLVGDRAKRQEYYWQRQLEAYHEMEEKLRDE